MYKEKMILFPSDYGDVHKVDEDFQEEYDAVINTGLFDICPFGYEEWFNHDRLVLLEVPDKPRKAVYRGWMMRPDRYMEFYNQLKAANIELVTTPEEYAQMHIFPNVYNFVKDDTAKMALFPLHEEIKVNELKSKFTRFMVKDYVKSVKGTDFPKYFENTVSQEEFNRWMEVFYKYRGNLLTGGICIKEFLDLKYYGDRTNEYRTFYINHQVATLSKNSGQSNITSRPPKELVEKYRNLPSIYYTVDYAELEDGSWKVVEAGDGSVSGLSEGQDYEAYFRALYHCLN